MEFPMKPLLFSFFLVFFLPLSVPCFPDQQVQPVKENEKTESIAYASSGSGNWQIWTMNPDDGMASQVTHGEQDVHYPAWDPNGREIACADSSGRILIVPMSGQQQVLPDLPENCTHPTWSPEGSKIAFVCHTFQSGREDSDIWIADLKAGKTRKLLEQQDIQNYPHWSPDGSSIVYTSGYRASPTKVIEELWLVNADGSNPRRLLSNGFSNVKPQWSPDGSRIAFASDQSGNMEIWVIDIDGKHIVQMTFDRAYDGDPTWSPDGSQICFASTRSGKMELWIMECSGANPKQLTGLSDSRGESLEPSWSRVTY
jgi:TolB protein